ncbi:hypothetical protein BDM02DRAFT_1971481 [Thelephora ganbajun]|uniref:Uncharacterized protein n=1 Tax=Thelephora ganbajun TaxID=370292 RepID=A0ACB6ZHA2_THEGA|nr:hypothetical protein BDM02DRAFT_1971481 [Thelephora ganbajun]
MKARSRGTNVPSILSAVSRDAAIYFALIASSHFLVVVMYSVVRPILRAVATVGNTAFIPMMITRIIISLKKVANTRQPQLSLEVPNRVPTSVQDSRPPRQVEGQG